MNTALKVIIGILILLVVLNIIGVITHILAGIVSFVLKLAIILLCVYLVMAAIQKWRSNHHNE